MKFRQSCWLQVLLNILSSLSLEDNTKPSPVFAVWSSKAVKSDKRNPKILRVKIIKIFLLCKCHVFEIAETEKASFEFSLHLLFHRRALEVKISTTYMECTDKREPCGTKGPWSPFPRPGCGPQEARLPHTEH